MATGRRAGFCRQLMILSRKASTTALDSSRSATPLPMARSNCLEEAGGSEAASRFSR